jgi:hypothetical protein
MAFTAALLAIDAPNLVAMLSRAKKYDKQWCGSQGPEALWMAAFWLCLCLRLQ